MGTFLLSQRIRFKLLKSQEIENIPFKIVKIFMTIPTKLYAFRINRGSKDQKKRIAES